LKVAVIESGRHRSGSPSDGTKRVQRKFHFRWVKFETNFADLVTKLFLAEFNQSSSRFAKANAAIFRHVGG